MPPDGRPAQCAGGEPVGRGSRFRRGNPASPGGPHRARPPRPPGRPYPAWPRAAMSSLTSDGPPVHALSSHPSTKSNKSACTICYAHDRIRVVTTGSISVALPWRACPGTWISGRLRGVSGRRPGCPRITGEWFVGGVRGHSGSRGGDRPGSGGRSRFAGHGGGAGYPVQRASPARCAAVPRSWAAVTAASLVIGPRSGLLQLLALGPAFAAVSGGLRKTVAAGVVALVLDALLAADQIISTWGAYARDSATVVGVTVAAVIAARCGSGGSANWPRSGPSPRSRSRSCSARSRHDAQRPAGGALHVGDVARPDRRRPVRGGARDWPGCG